MTGTHMIDEGRVRLGESLSTTAQQQGMLWPKHMRRSADEVARELYCLFAVSTLDIISGQIQYPTPLRPFRLQEVCVNDGNGNIFPLAGINRNVADNRYWNWNAQPPATPTWTGVPAVYVDDGGNTLSLIPVPNYNCQDGLMLYGYFGVDDWWNMADECPLKEGYSEVVITGACMRRCLEMKRVDPSYADLYKDYKVTYEELVGRLYSERIGMSEATRESIPSFGKRLGYWSGMTLFGGSY